MDLMQYRETLPTNRIEIYGLVDDRGTLDFLVMYHLEDVQFQGTYLGKDYMAALQVAGSLEQTLDLPTYDFVGLFNYEFADASLRHLHRGLQ
jgi:hypothetical protein